MQLILEGNISTGEYQDFLSGSFPSSEEKEAFKSLSCSFEFIFYSKSLQHYVELKAIKRLIIWKILGLSFMEGYSEPCQTSETRLFTKKVNG